MSCLLPKTVMTLIVIIPFYFGNFLEWVYLTYISAIKTIINIDFSNYIVILMLIIARRL